MFKRTEIYIKIHTGVTLKYFGKYTKRNVKTYRGSGKKWKRHYKKYGYAYIKTFVIRTFEEHQKQECMDFCIWFSRINNIVKSKQWANLKEESGI